jgi:hypothetical protein
MKRPQKITLAEMREMGVRGLLVYCSADLEPLFVCQACGTKPADLRPNFHWKKEQQKPRHVGATTGRGSWTKHTHQDWTRSGRLAFPRHKVCSLCNSLAATPGRSNRPRSLSNHSPPPAQACRCFKKYKIFQRDEGA